MTNIMINQNMPVEKTVEAIKTKIAESPNNCVTKFAYDKFRYTIEHHKLNDWTIAVENIETGELEDFLENITTINLAEILNDYML